MKEDSGAAHSHSLLLGLSCAHYFRHSRDVVGASGDRRPASFPTLGLKRVLGEHQDRRERITLLALVYCEALSLPIQKLHNELGGLKISVAWWKWLSHGDRTLGSGLSIFLTL